MNTIIRICLILFYTQILYANQLIDCYRFNDIKCIENILEKNLQNPKYWNEYLSDYETKFGFIQNKNNILVCNKSEPQCKLYGIDNNKLSLISSQKALIGAGSGDKQFEGDLKTPIGIYELTSKLSSLPQKYGHYAFVTSYPNTLDRLKGKSGSGIWVHGFPLDGADKFNTRGCIAMNNSYMKEIENKIDYKKSILIISQKSIKKVKNSDLSILLASLYKWRYAWINSDFDKYISYYNKKFKRFDGKTLTAFKSFKTSVFNNNRNLTKKIIFSNINIIISPNTDYEKLFRITFYEKYTDGKHHFNGNKELYATIIDNKMSIVVEK
jgi:murein L,D-transpeptidase YafK